MPDLKKTFKKAGKKIKKVLTKKSRRRARRNNGLGNAPVQGNAPEPEQQQPRWQGVQRPGGERNGPRIGNRPKNVWQRGDKKEGGGGGPKIGERKKPVEKVEEEKSGEETKPSSEPKDQSKSSSGYSTDQSNYTTDKSSNYTTDQGNYSTNQQAGEGSDSQESSGASEVVEEPVDGEPEVEAKGGGETNYGTNYGTSYQSKSGGRPYSDLISSSSASTPMSEIERREAEAKKKFLLDKRDTQLKLRIEELKRRRKEEHNGRVLQTLALKEGNKKEEPVETGYKSNYTTESNYKSSNGLDDEQLSSSEPQHRRALISSSSQDENLPSNERTKDTDEIVLTQDELNGLRADIERKLGIGVPDVQAIFEGNGVPEPIALMQRKLRENSKGNVDPDEILPSGATNKVTRDVMSPNESDSKGFALLPMRDTYHELDRGKGKGAHGFDTKYLFDETTALEGVAQTLGSRQEKTRAERVIRFVDGKWKNAKDELVDTSDGASSAQAFNERRLVLKKKLDEAEPRLRTGELNGMTQEQLDRLSEKVQSMRDKMLGENVDKHVTVSGKYIYVMNAAGDFFAAPGIAMVLHHSSFLAGGAVASAGDIGITGGVTNYISNQSGHYRPGPAYLWQAVMQLKQLGVPLGSVMVKVMGVSTPFRSGDDFLQAMDPTADPKLFDGQYAIDLLKGKALEAKKKNKEQGGNEQPSQQQTEVKV